MSAILSSSINLLGSQITGKLLAIEERDEFKFLKLFWIDALNFLRMLEEFNLPRLEEKLLLTHLLTFN